LINCFEILEFWAIFLNVSNLNPINLIVYQELIVLQVRFRNICIPFDLEPIIIIFWLSHVLAPWLAPRICLFVGAAVALVSFALYGFGPELSA